MSNEHSRLDASIYKLARNRDERESDSNSIENKVHEDLENLYRRSKEKISGIDNQLHEGKGLLARFFDKLLGKDRNVSVVPAKEVAYEERGVKAYVAANALNDFNGKEMSRVSVLDKAGEATKQSNNSLNAFNDGNENRVNGEVMR